jgi:uncharacterized repeat protein (TIGR03803 family)
MLCGVALMLVAVTAITGKAAELTSLTSQTPNVDALAYDAISQSVLWSFAGGPDDGANPVAGLIADKWGNLYGTTAFGGPNEVGTVFELSPPVGEQTQWSEHVLWSFDATADDGINPVAALTADKWGNLYSTTSAGGAGGICSGFGCGTVFELSPPAGQSTRWNESLLWPSARLLMTARILQPPSSPISGAISTVRLSEAARMAFHPVAMAQYSS